MKKYSVIGMICFSIISLLASCQCRKCTKANEPNYTVCKNEGSQQDYDNTIAFLEAGGFDCPQ